MDNQYKHHYYVVEWSDQTFMVKCQWCERESEIHLGRFVCRGCGKVSEAKLDLIIRKVEAEG